MFEVDNGLANANVPRTIRFTESMFKEIQEIAFKNNISFNLLVLQCCRYALEVRKSTQTQNEHQEEHV